MHVWLSNEPATVSDLPTRAIRLAELGVELSATHLGEPELAWRG
jgi:hypothetical protein